VAVSSLIDPLPITSPINLDERAGGIGKKRAENREEEEPLAGYGSLLSVLFSLPPSISTSEQGGF
jgi:hypothetical protein